jgi:hypothetical protein
MVTGSARLAPLSDDTANCRPDLPSQRAPHREKTATFLQEVISGRKCHKGARYQDMLTDRLAVSCNVTWTSSRVAVTVIELRLLCDM